MTKKAKTLVRQSRAAKIAKPGKDSNKKVGRQSIRNQSQAPKRTTQKIKKNRNGVRATSTSKKPIGKKNGALKAAKQNRMLLENKYELRSKKSNLVSKIPASGNNEVRTNRRILKMPRKSQPDPVPQTASARKLRISLGRTKTVTDVREKPSNKKEKTLKSKVSESKSARDHKLTKETWVDDSSDTLPPAKPHNIPASFVVNTEVDFAHLTPIGSATSLLPSVKEIDFHEITKERPSIISLLQNKPSSMDDLPLAHEQMDFSHTDPLKHLLSYSNRTNTAVCEYNEARMNEEARETVARIPSVQEFVVEKGNQENTRLQRTGFDDRSAKGSEAIPSGKRSGDARAIQMFYDHICDSNLLRRIKSDPELHDKVKTVLPKKYRRVFAVFDRLESLFVNFARPSYFLSTINKRALDKPITIDDIAALIYLEKNYYSMDWVFNTDLNDYDLLLKTEVFELSNSRMGLSITEIRQARSLRIVIKLLEFVKMNFDGFASEKSQAPSNNLNSFEDFLNSAVSDVPRPKFKPKPESFYVQ